MYDFVSLNLKCTVCGVSIMDREHTVDNKPSIHMKIEMGGVKGNVYLSSIYGSYNFTCDIPMNTGEIVSFTCPHCDKEISSNSECLTCGAPMVPFYLDMGGKVSICSRSGCKNHFVEFEDLTLAMQRLYEDYSLDETHVHKQFTREAKKKEEPEDEAKEMLLTGTFLNTYCPHCKKSLIENDLLKLKVNRSGEIGELLLSPYLNVFTSKSTIYLPEDQLVGDISCFHCGESLIETEKKCEVCNSPVAKIEVGARTRLLDFYICTKKGCRWHGLKEEDMFDIKLDDSMEW
ncbi:MAG: hypothetical protein NTU44_19755 [Bacteroidetes bacterium]|nr:hypothetical protein [Bacteroidota bacterium]